MILANAASESHEAEQAIQKAVLVLKMREGIGSLARILKTIEVSSMLVNQIRLSTRNLSSLIKLPRYRNCRGTVTFAGHCPEGLGHLAKLHEHVSL